MTQKSKDLDSQDANKDPITGEPGSHPIGTAIGAATLGAAMGAGAGSIVGPIGTALGAAGGAVLGGLTGNAIAENLDPTHWENYWRENYAAEPYYEKGRPYGDYAPAYRVGYQARGKREPDVAFDSIAAELEADYNRSKGASSLGWDRAQHATRAAWERAAPGAKET